MRQLSTVIILLMFAGCAMRHPDSALLPPLSPLQDYTVDHDYFNFWQTHITAPSFKDVVLASEATCVSPYGALIRLHGGPKPDDGILVACDQVYRVTGGAGDRYAIFTNAFQSPPENRRLSYLHAETNVGKTDPPDGFMPLYFLRVLSDASRGDVYELNWPGEMGGGTGHWAGERRFLLLRSPGGAWKILTEITGGCAGHDGGTEVQLAVAWNPKTSAKLPVVVKITQIDIDNPTGEGEETPALYTVRHGVLDDAGQPRWSSGSFIQVQPGNDWKYIADGLLLRGEANVLEHHPKLLPQLESIYLGALKEANPAARELAANQELAFPDDQKIAKQVGRLAASDGGSQAAPPHP